MSVNYGVSLIPDAHKNAINVVYALRQSEDPSGSENISQPANVSGLEGDDWTHWFGGRPYTLEQLATLQDLANNVPSATWPVTGVSGPVTLAQAQAAIAALVVFVTSQETWTPLQGQETLDAVLTAKGIKKVVFEG